MRRCVAILLFSFALVGCTYKYRHYGYEEAKISLHGGVLTVSLQPGYRQVSKDPNICEYRNPYCLVIVFEHDDPKLEGEKMALTQTASVNDGLSILQERDEGVLKLKQVKRGFRSKTLAVYERGFCNIELAEHSPVKVSGEVIFENKSASYDVILQPKYWERLNNGTYDAVMIY
ncbi:MAG: hypothetical protein KDI30_09445 [Pseudomonadales bacterium]|nr:hypothetical protein [Pseudomonadales bacterium]